MHRLLCHPALGEHPSCDNKCSWLGDNMPPPRVRNTVVAVFFRGGRFPVLTKFPDFSPTFPDVYDIPATVYKRLEQNMITTMWIGKISFCVLLWQSITLMSSALNRTQAVRLCWFCDHHNRGNTISKTHFPWLFPLSRLFADHSQIPWLFQAFQAGGRPVFYMDGRPSCHPTNSSKAPFFHFPDFSLTNIKFLDFSRFSRLVAALFLQGGMPFLSPNQQQQSTECNPW